MKFRYAEPSCDPRSPVELMPEGSTQIAGEGTLFQTAAPSSYTMNGKTGSNVVLRLDELSMPAHAAGILRVYVGEPGNAQPAICNEETVPEQYLPQNRCAFADNLAQEIYLVSGSQMSNDNSSTPKHTCIQLALCPKLAKAVTEANGETQVHIVPVGLGDDGAPGGVPEGTGISVSKPYFTVEE